MNFLYAMTTRHSKVGDFVHGILSNPFTAGIAIIVVISYIVDRQLRPRPLSGRELLLLPLVLLYLGGNALWKHTVTMPTAVDAIGSIAIGLYFGYRSLGSVKVYAGKDGEAVVEGTWSYLKWYVFSLLCRALLVGMLYLAFSGGLTSKTLEAGLLLSTGIFIGIRSLDLYYRATRLGIPLAQKRGSR